jgi:hypothetical protein
MYLAEQTVVEQNNLKVLQKGTHHGKLLNPVTPENMSNFCNGKRSEKNDRLK